MENMREVLCYAMLIY